MMSGSASLKTTLLFLKRCVLRFDEDRCFAAAASLSYTSLLALVPLTAIAFAVMGAFPVFNDIEAEIQGFLFDNLLPSAVESVKEHIESFVGRARSLTAVGVVGLAVTALLLFVTIETAIDVIFKSTGSRSMVRRLLVFWAILTLGPLLIGASFSLAMDAFAFTRMIGGDVLEGPLAWLSQILPTLLLAAAFTLFYTIIPTRPIRIAHALIGGVVAGVLFTLLKSGFTAYVTAFPAYNNVYGALATIPMFLFWMYLSWAVILIGAVVTAELPNWGRPALEINTPPAPGTHLANALGVLAILYRGTREGRPVKRRALVTAPDIPGAVADALLKDLRDARLIARTDSGRWLPVRDAASTTLGDVISALGLDLRGEHIPAAADGAAWRRRLAEIIAADAAASRDRLSVSLQTLLGDLGDGATRGEESAPAAPAGRAALPLRRAP
jgi:membrane protein